MHYKKIYITILIIILLIIPINIAYGTVDTSTLNTECPSVILMESSTGKILYEKNAYEKMYPASVTKVLTAIIVLENCELTDIAKVSYNAIMSVPVGYSHAYLQLDEELTIEQLLNMLLINSANDAANVLAEHVAGSIESFSTMMNTRATELGCKNTHFTNPSGIHDENHYSTAYDLALMTKYAMKNETFRSIVSSETCSISQTNKYEARVLKNTNLLLRQDGSSSGENYYYKYAIGVKTGFTEKAKNCLIAAAERDNLELISVMLGAEQTADGLSQRYVDAINLFNFGFDNYVAIRVKDANSIITDDIPNNLKGLDVVVNKDIDIIVEKQDSNMEFTPQINWEENLKLPILKDTVVGNITYTVNDYTYSSELLAGNDLENPPIATQIFRLLLLAFIILILFKAVKPKKKNRRKNYRKK